MKGKLVCKASLLPAVIMEILKGAFEVPERSIGAWKEHKRNSPLFTKNELDTDSYCVDHAA